MESRSLLVTRHEPSTFPKIGSKNANNFWNCSGSKVPVEKNLDEPGESTVVVFVTKLQNERDGACAVQVAAFDDINV